MLLVLLAAVALRLSGPLCEASEFPERECCDPVYPTVPDTAVPSDSDFVVATVAGPAATGAGSAVGSAGGAGGSSPVPGVFGVGAAGEKWCRKDWVSAVK